MKSRPIIVAVAMILILAACAKHEGFNKALQETLMDNNDRKMLNNTFEHKPSGTIVSWVNSESKVKYQAIPEPAFSLPSHPQRPCRKTVVTAIINDDPIKETVTACRNSRGQWVVNETHYQYSGNKFPPLESDDDYPSFTISREINEGLRANWIDAKGSSHFDIDITILKNGKNNSGKIVSFLDWEYEYRDDKFYAEESLKTSINNNKKGMIEINLRSIYDRFGNTIEKNLSSNMDLKELPKDTVDYIKNDNSKHHKKLFSMNNSVLKTGDILNHSPVDFSKFGIDTVELKEIVATEKVKGLGKYNDREVLVAQNAIDDSVNQNDRIVEIRGKGYNLYDADTFILLESNGILYINTFTPTEGTTQYRIESLLMTNDVEINK